MFENEDDRKTAATKWTTLKNEFLMEGHHTRLYIKELKNVSLPIANPNCDPKKEM